MMKPTVPTLFLSTWMALTGCGSDDGGGQDAICLAPADPVNSCPGQVMLEFETLDLVTENREPFVTATEVGTGNTAKGAPNGRVILCVDTVEDREVVFVRTNEPGVPDTLTTRATISAAVYATGLPAIRIPVSSADDADAFANQAGQNRNAEDTLLVADFTTCSGNGAQGASLTDAPGPGPFERAATATGVMPVDAVTRDGHLIYFNAPGAAVSLPTTPASNTRCVGPETAASEADGITFAAFRCGPA